MLDSAKKFGLEVIAITDHDSVAGIDEAIEYGNKIGIYVIPGIEITATSGFDVKSIKPHTRIDILGYKIDWHSSILKKFYEDLSNLKIQWVKNIIDYLNKKGYSLDFESLKGYSEFFLIKQLIEKKVCKDRDEAKKLIRIPEILNHYPYIRPSLQASIGLILKIGGIPVLAHAYRGLGRNAFTDNQVFELINVLKSYGLMGVETHHYFHIEEQRYDKLLKVCKILNLIPTIGSDHHSSTEKYKGITDDDKRMDIFNIINHDFHEILELCLKKNN